MAARAVIDLVYCAGGNARFAQIAINHGFLYGAQLPTTVYHSVWFADQNWKSPNKEAYIKALSLHKPYMASVLDLEHPHQVEEVLGWAEDVAKHVEIVMIIPKYKEAIRDIPLTICNKPVRLGYSVPTKFGGSPVPLRDFHDWPVHLLGGSPSIQMELWQHLNVHSADGNSAQMAAMKGTVFTGTRWLNMHKYLGYHTQGNMMYKAFDISCENIKATWRMTTR